MTSRLITYANVEQSLKVSIGVFYPSSVGIKYACALHGHEHAGIDGFSIPGTLQMKGNISLGPSTTWDLWIPRVGLKMGTVPACPRDILRLLIRGVQERRPKAEDLNGSVFLTGNSPVQAGHLMKTALERAPT